MSARAWQVQPLPAVAAELGLSERELTPYGHDAAKLPLALKDRPARGKLVLISAINPTPAGEGKTTTSIGLAMGLRRRGARVVLALREPSLGPVFGVKGGGTGGGQASLEPADDINLHFTGDLHAITSAHNLLSALLDNALHFGTEVAGAPLDPRRISWGRALDMNDRALRNVVVGLGGEGQGMPRAERFDITAASEVMAVLALASDLEDLQARLGRILVARHAGGAPVRAGDLGAAAAMTALLRKALQPNLVQTREGGPVLVHAGPFANIAHGCNSVLATRMALGLGDITLTEAGFGFDLGGEKFLNIKCRQLGRWPDALVLVLTVRALKLHGGAELRALSEANSAALQAGLEHLEKHLQNAKEFGLPVLLAVNRFPDDREEELQLLRQAAARYGVVLACSEAYARGGEGALELADALQTLLAATPNEAPAPRYSYELSQSPAEKITAIARKVYGARDVQFARAAERTLGQLAQLGMAEAPVCMAKTHLSLSDDAKLRGRPRDFGVTVRELRVCAGAGFVVAITGDMMTMPGLPRVPAAERVRLAADGRIRGLMQND